VLPYVGFMLLCVCLYLVFCVPDVYYVCLIDFHLILFVFLCVCRVTVSLSDGSSGSPLRKNQIAVGFYKQAHEAASARDITLLYLTDGLYKPVGRASDLNFCMGGMRKWEAAVKSGPAGVKQLLVDMKIRSFFVDLKEKHIVSYVSGNKFMVRAEGGLQLAYSFLSGDGKSSHLTTCQPIPPEKPKKSGVISINCGSLDRFMSW